jgi:glycosyltransferase involved in cell wall biosynthesis
MSGPRPLLSVVVPAHQGGSLLPETLAALAESDLGRERWELIVVDDASSDATSAVAARWADQVLTFPGAPRGPGFARNRGVEVSRGEWVVFVDGDVRVHADTLRRVAEAIAQDPGMDALFGAYDDAPPAPGFLSRYRNLLHRYVHLTGAGETDTFWAGCGAVRRTAFLAAGGFNEARYPRPQIEDIELGYRLRDRGSRIVIRPEIQGTHLKAWTFMGALRTDLLDRGVPWVRLLLERQRLAQPASLNLKRGEPLKTALVALGLLLLVLAAVTRRWPLLAGAVAVLGVVLVSNHALFGWFARQRGAGFALGVIPFNLLYYLVGGVSVAAGLALHLLHGRPRIEPPVALTPREPAANSVSFTGQGLR